MIYDAQMEPRAKRRPARRGQRHQHGSSRNKGPCGDPDDGLRRVQAVWTSEALVELR